MEQNSQAQLLANMLCELENLESGKAETLKDMNADIKTQKEAISTLAAEVRHGQGSLLADEQSE
ncbi:MAG: hypothetical protein V3W44_08670 [Dehalococcoidales bacterium]